MPLSPWPGRNRLRILRMRLNFSLRSLGSRIRREADPGDYGSSSRRQRASDRIPLCTPAAGGLWGVCTVSFRSFESPEFAPKGLTESPAYDIVIERDKIQVFFLCLKIGKRRNQAEVANMRTRITLACTECKQRNYNTTKDKKTHPDRMETSKYCRFCRKHTVHKETK